MQHNCLVCIFTWVVAGDGCSLLASWHFEGCALSEFWLFTDSVLRAAAFTNLQLMVPKIFELVLRLFSSVLPATHLVE
jgi:hypothetical protein